MVLALTKEEIIKDEAVKAAQALFQQYGLHKTTMEDIAKAMGRGKSTLYYYYKSKDEIFEAVIIKEIEEVFEKTKNAINAQTLAEDKLKLYFAVLIKEVKSKSNLYYILRGELKDNYTQVNIVIKKFNTQDVKIVKEILLLGIANGEFSNAFQDDIELLAYSAVSASRSLAVDLVIEEKFPNWDNRLEVLINVIIKGLK